jgi:deoxyadenosine/deoxycytidine kinase
MTKVKIVSVDGNIGSGKSTFIQDLKNYFKDREDICFLDEPVDKWKQIIDNDDKNILENYYLDQKKWGFSFQMMAYISRLSQLKEALNREKYKIIFTERSVESDRNIFAKMLYDEGIIEEIDYKIYNLWFDEFKKDLGEFKYIYLKTKPSTALARVIKRQRKEEKIELDYLEKCHNYHEKWLNNLCDNKILILDGNIERERDSIIMENRVKLINNFMQKIEGCHVLWKL